MKRSARTLSRALLAALWLAAAPAVGEEPRSLVPRMEPPFSTAPAPPAPISVAPLASPDIAAAGLAAVPGWNPDFSRSDPARLVAILDRLPTALPSEALATRLAARIAAPWAGAGGGVALLAARVRALLRLGAAREAAALALLGETGGQMNPELRLLAAEAFATTGEVERACAVAEPLEATDMAVVALDFACALLHGQAPRATLALELARERGILPPASFSTFAEAALSGSPLPVELAEDGTRAGRLLLLATHPLALTAPLPASAPPALLRAVARNPEVPVEVRLDAGERAAVLGQFTISEWRSMAGTLADVATASDGRSPSARAHLLRALAGEGVALARAALLARAVTAVAAGSERVRWLEALSVDAEALPVDRSLLFAESGILPPLLARGLFERARAWLELAATTPDETRSDRERARLPATLALAGLSPFPASGDRPSVQRALLYALADGLGIAIDTDAWTALLVAEMPGDPRPPPSVGLWHAASDAASSGRRGEAVLAAFALLAPAVEAAQPQALAHALTVLRQAEEDELARLLAVAVALALRL